MRVMTINQSMLRIAASTLTSVDSDVQRDAADDVPRESSSPR